MADAEDGRPVALWKSGLLALLAAVVTNYAVRAGAVALFDIPAEFPPLAGPGPVVFFTVISTIGAVGVFAGIASVSRRPVGVFRVVAGLVLLVSFSPDLWLLTEQGAVGFPGATAAGVGALMLMHVVSAAIILWAVEGGR